MVLAQGWKAHKVAFIVVDPHKSYNVILGCTNLNHYNMVALTCHQKMKFIIPHGIGELKCEAPTYRRCYVNALRCRNQVETLPTYSYRCKSEGGKESLQTRGGIYGG